MSGNLKKDKTMFAAKIAAIVLCALAFVAGALYGYFSGSSFGMDFADDVDISDVADIVERGESLFNDNCALSADISIDDASLRIGSSDKPFEGVFDGKGYIITCSFASAPDGWSLFGSIGEGGVVRNVNLVISDVTAEGSAFAGIALINYGKIENCHIFYDLSASDPSGMYSPCVAINRGSIDGIVAEGTFSAASTMSVESGVAFGGVCAYNYGIINAGIAVPKFEGFECTKEYSILIGATVNPGIAAVCAYTAGDGQTQYTASLMDRGVYTSDRSSLDLFTDDSRQLFNEDIFKALNFDNRYWRLVASGLELIGGAQ